MFFREINVGEKKRVTVGIAAVTVLGRPGSLSCSNVGFWLLQLINRGLTDWHDSSFPLVKKLLYTIISAWEENVKFILKLREISE